MCLYTNKKKPNKTTENITCYKVVQFGSNGYYTPYQMYTIDKDIISGEKLLTPSNTGIAHVRICTSASDYQYEIREGFIHTFKNVYDARSTADDLRKHSFTKKDDVKIFKCIIPRATVYHEGNGRLICETPVYASTAIKFIEEI